MELYALDSKPVDLALARYDFIYVVQGETLHVIHPSQGIKTITLPFAPKTWSSFGGSVCFYDPAAGIVQLSGSSVALLETGEHTYSAPYGVPFRDNSPLLGNETFQGLELNGALLEKPQDFNFWRFTTFNKTFEHEPLGVLVEHGEQMVFSNNASQFGFYNGITGPLFYAQVPKQVVPYSLSDKGILAGGTPNGYVFSPDMGTSWRYRKLNGWGIFTNKAILEAKPGALTLIKGIAL